MKHVILFLSIVFFTFCSVPQKETKSELPQKEKQVIRIGDTLHTAYFDVTVNNVDISRGIEIPSADVGIMAGEGNTFVIIQAMFTNVDTETRAAEEGVLYVRQNGKQYSFEKTEEIMAKGWGLFFDPINPLMSQKTNIVYKIPNNIKGELLWQPGRAEENEIISLINTDTITSKNE